MTIFLTPTKPLFALCLAAALPLAQAAEPLDESRALDEGYFFAADMPLVLSASRLAQPISESPASISVIDRATIEASGALNIPDVLRLVPGFQVSHLSGQNLTAQYHGMADQNPKRMQVLIDGRSVYHAAFGGVRWDTLSITLNDIERIEVLRGSNAAAYGSNAFMGVVNIVTRHPSHDQGHQVTLTAGYNDTYQVDWRYGGREGNFDYRIALSAFSTTGFPSYREVHDYWDSTGVIPPDQVVSFTPYVPRTFRTIERDDDQQIGRFNFRGDHLLPNGDQLLIEAGMVRNDRDDNMVEGDFHDMHPDQNLRSTFQLLKWTRQTANQGELSVQFSHNRLGFENTYTDYYITNDANFVYNYGPVLGGYQFVNHRYDVELQSTLPDVGGWRMVLGGGARLDTVKGFNVFDDGAARKRVQWRAFANTEKHFGSNKDWVLNAGLMIEHQDDLGFFASPRLALNHHLDPHHTVRVAASHAYRMPSFIEEHAHNVLFALDPSNLGLAPYTYAIVTDDPFTLDPESVTTLEFGFLSNNWIDGLTLDARVFHERLRKLIKAVVQVDGCNNCDTAPAALGFQPHDIDTHENAGWMDIQGIDLQARFDPNDRTTLITSLSLARAEGYGYRTRDSSGNLVTSDVDDMSVFVPRTTFSALLSHRFDNRWSGSLGYYAMSDMDWPQEGDYLDRYKRIDLRLAKQLNLAGADTEVELIVQNLTDENYNEFNRANVFERRAYLRVKFDLD